MLCFWDLLGLWRRGRRDYCDFEIYESLFLSLQSCCFGNDLINWFLIFVFYFFEGYDGSGTASIFGEGYEGKN
jgi:hypothetical protein